MKTETKNKLQWRAGRCGKALRFGKGLGGRLTGASERRPGLPHRRKPRCDSARAVESFWRSYATPAFWSECPAQMCRGRHPPRRGEPACLAGGRWGAPTLRGKSTNCGSGVRPQKLQRVRINPFLADCDERLLFASRSQLDAIFAASDWLPLRAPRTWSAIWAGSAMSRFQNDINLTARTHPPAISRVVRCCQLCRSASRYAPHPPH
jgi:hypothetical protein